MPIFNLTNKELGKLLCASGTWLRSLEAVAQPKQQAKPTKLEAEAHLQTASSEAIQAAIFWANHKTSATSFPTCLAHP